MLKKELVLLPFVFVLACSSITAHAAVPKKKVYKGEFVDTSPRYDLSIAALALQPAASNLNYVIYNRASLPVQTPVWTEQELRPGYGPGFELGARYLPGMNQDISLTWTHFIGEASASVGGGPGYFLGPDYQIGPPSLPIQFANGSTQFKYDVVNLMFGQAFAFNRYVGARFFAGLSNAYLREQVNATYSGTLATGTFPGPFSTRQEVTANFTGIGPRLGFDLTYDTDVGIGFLAEGAASALIGSSYAKTVFESSAQQLMALFGQSTNIQTIQDKSFVQVIPAFDSKLGINYKGLLNNNGALFKIEAGWEAAVYINAINQYLPGTLVDDAPSTTGGIFVATMNHTQSNYSVQGPYLKAVIEL